MMYRFFQILSIVVSFSFAAQAELLLLEKTGHGYEAADYEASENKSDLDEIFNHIFLKYQWPMVTMYFPDFSQNEKQKYMNDLQQKHGIVKFINNKIEKKYKDKYKVIFIPETIFELGVLNSFSQTILDSSTSPNGPNEQSQSIFPPKDLRNGYYVLNESKIEFADKIIEGLNQFANSDNAAVKMAQNVYGGYNLNPAVKETYFQTIKYLWIKYKDQLDSFMQDEVPDKIVDYLVRTMAEDFMTTYPHFYEKLKKTEKSRDGIFKGFLKPEDVDILITSTFEEIKASHNNTFLLFRGSLGFDLAEGTDKKGEQTLIDSPAQEILEDFTNFAENTPLKHVVPLRPAKELSPFAPAGLFTPTTLSYGNSLLAGTFFDCGEKGARALDYSRNEGLGYALVFPIKEYLAPIGDDIPLFKKYFVSPFHSIVGLMFGGEFFHSRSKMSLTMPKKEWSQEFKGIVMDPYVKKILYQDWGGRTGFLVTPDLDWRKLSSEVTHDISKNIVWLKPMEPKTRKLLIETQKNVGDFVGMELEAFKEHVEKFQPVLAQINPKGYQHNTKKSLKGADNISSPLEARPYDPSNAFWAILQNPTENLKTTKRNETQYSLAFDNFPKRTMTHVLVIPKGKYSSFSHFVDNANSDEIVDFWRAIATTADIMKLNPDGYRIISNNALNPRDSSNNNAHQEVPHFHVHLSGGECLGKPVAAIDNLEDSHESVKMDVSTPPYGYGLSTEEFLKNIFMNKVSDMTFENEENQKRRLIAYRIPARQLKIPEYIGFVLLDEKRKSVYQSIDDFCKTASPKELIETLKFINNVAKKLKIYDSGFRLIGGHGRDAWHFPQNVMQFSIAGGNKLGVTVTNAWGNRRKSSEGYWEHGKVYDYEDLIDMPHQHCPVNSSDYLTFMESLEGKAALDEKNKSAYNDAKKAAEKFDALNLYNKSESYHNKFEYVNGKVYETTFNLYLGWQEEELVSENLLPAVIKREDNKYEFVANSAEGLKYFKVPKDLERWLSLDDFFKDLDAPKKLILHYGEGGDRACLDYLRGYKVDFNTEKVLVPSGEIQSDTYRNLFEYENGKVYEITFNLYLGLQEEELVSENLLPAVIKRKDNKYEFVANSPEGLRHFKVPKDLERWLSLDVFFKDLDAPKKLILHYGEGGDRDCLDYLRRYKAGLSAEKVLVPPREIQSDTYHNKFEYENGKVYETTFNLYLGLQEEELVSQNLLPAVIKRKDNKYEFVANSPQGLKYFKVPKDLERWLSLDVFFKDLDAPKKLILHYSEGGDRDCLDYLRAHKVHLNTEKVLIPPGEIQYEFFRNMDKTYKRYKKINERIKTELKSIAPVILKGSKDMATSSLVAKKMSNINDLVIRLREYNEFISSYQTQLTHKKNFTSWEDDHSFWELFTYDSTYKWIFIDLDALNQAMLYQDKSAMKHTFEAFVKSGFQIIGITDSTDTLEILQRMKSDSIRVTNPENLPAFNLLRGDSKDGSGQPTFKDGVIFCANSRLEKSVCLELYLKKLAQKQGDFPAAILYYGNDAHNLDDILKKLKNLEIPATGYLYEKIDYGSDSGLISEEETEGEGTL